MNIPALGKCYLCLERDVLMIESHLFPVQFGKTVTGGRGKDDTFLVHPAFGFKENYHRSHPMWTKDHPLQNTNPQELGSLAAKKGIFCKECELYFKKLEDECIPLLNDIPLSFNEPPKYLPHVAAGGQVYIEIEFAANIMKLFLYSVIWRLLLLKVLYNDYPFWNDYDHLRNVLITYKEKSFGEIANDAGMDDNQDIILVTRPHVDRFPFYLTTMLNQFIQPSLFFMAEYNAIVWMKDGHGPNDKEWCMGSKFLEGSLKLKTNHVTKIAIANRAEWLKPMNDWENMNLVLMKFGWIAKICEKFGMPHEQAENLLETKANFMAWVTGRFILSCYYQVFRELMYL